MKEWVTQEYYPRGTFVFVHAPGKEDIKYKVEDVSFIMGHWLYELRRADGTGKKISCIDDVLSIWDA